MKERMQKASGNKASGGRTQTGLVSELPAAGLSAGSRQRTEGAKETGMHRMDQHHHRGDRCFECDRGYGDPADTGEDLRRRRTKDTVMRRTMRWTTEILMKVS